MTYVITRSCCNDASCVEVCPVDCIHPTPDEPGFASAEMLYIQPEECIDCGACVDACPAGAVYPDFDVPAHLAHYAAINADYYDWTGEPPAPAIPPAAGPRVTEQAMPLRVAVVGSGPAGWYVADELTRSRRAEIEVTVIDRLATPYGLVRFGVAPDHLDTKGVTEAFERVAGHRRASTRFNVEIGRDVTHEELLRHFHAVVYATGASQGRSLGIPGESLPGSLSAAEFVGWYNGHPDHSGIEPALAHSRAVVIGNGNVALDVARVLLAPPDVLAASDIAPHALDALASSAIEEVVVIGRRDASHAAFTSPELDSLVHAGYLDLVVDAAEVAGLSAALETEERTAASYAARQKASLLLAAAEAAPTGAKRLRLRFGLTPDSVVGDSSATGLRVVPTGGGEPEEIEAGLVVRATGYLPSPVPGVPFDESHGRFANDAGRVLDPASGEQVPGTYVAGWAKRGPTGVIGTNRADAFDTVRSLLDDYAAGALPDPPESGFDDLLASRGVQALDLAAWQALDRHELAEGEAAGRPRVKVVDREEQLRIASGVTV